MVAVVTDDMAIMLKRKEDIESLKKELSQHRKISDLGELKWYLGFRVQRNHTNRTILINQQAYIEVILD